MNVFYVYAYIDPRDGTPFYIGKGKDKRDRDHLHPTNLKRRSFFYHKLRKLLRQHITPEICRICVGLSEEEAFSLETFFIHALGRRNLGTGCLCNLTNGGDGPSGVIVSNETRQKLSKVWKGRKRAPFSAEHLRKMSEVRLGVKRGPHTATTRQKMSEAHRGKVLSAGHRQKLSDAKQNVSEETRQKMSEAQKGRRHSAETRQRISEAHKGSRRPAKTGHRISIAKWRTHWLKSGGTTCLNTHEVELWRL